MAKLVAVTPDLQPWETGPMRYAVKVSVHEVPSCIANGVVVCTRDGRYFVLVTVDAGYELRKCGYSELEEMQLYKIIDIIARHQLLT